jgi:hypothetical protein
MDNSQAPIVTYDVVEAGEVYIGAWASRRLECGAREGSCSEDRSDGFVSCEWRAIHILVDDDACMPDVSGAMQ